MWERGHMVAEKCDNSSSIVDYSQLLVFFVNFLPWL